MARRVHHLRLPETPTGLTLCKREITDRYWMAEPSQVVSLEADGEKVCPVCRRKAEKLDLLERFVALADDGSVDYEACGKDDKQLESYLRRLGLRM